MSAPTAEALKTSLYDAHLGLGAQMVEFSGWMMPLQYTSMRDEHTAVRERVGLFDVSHMGEFRLRGPRAEAALDRVVTKRLSDLAVGQARYNAVCTDSGGIIDDSLVYRDGADQFTVVVNAGPRLRDLEHFRQVIGGDCEVEDLTLGTALIAVQGPRALDLLRPLADFAIDDIGYYHFHPGRLNGLEVNFSRTGYTGEDGFELFMPWAEAPGVWRRLLDAGRPPGGPAAGRGAR